MGNLAKVLEEIGFSEPYLNELNVVRNEIKVAKNEAKAAKEEANAAKNEAQKASETIDLMQRKLDDSVKRMLKRGWGPEAIATDLDLPLERVLQTQTAMEKQNA